MFENGDTFRLCKPFYFILKAFGLGCYSLDKKTKALKVTLLDKFIFIASIGLWILFIKIQLNKRFAVDYITEVNSALLNNLWLHQYIIQHICGLSSIVFSFFQTRKIEDFFKIIENFDQKAANFNLNIKCQEKIFKTAIFLFVNYVLLLLLYLIMYAVDNYFSGKYSTAVIMINCFNYVFILLFYVVLSEQFVISALCIRARLAAMNAKLR